MDKNVHVHLHMDNSSNYSSSFFFFFFFFWEHDFQFLINWEIFFFPLVVCHFFVLIGHHFLTKGVLVNLYKLTFSIIPFSHSQPNKNERN